MKGLLVILIVSSLCPLLSRAQLYPPNEIGVTYGQFYTIVRDVETTKKFWVAMGGTPIEIDGMDVMKFHGAFVFLAPGTPAGGTDGTALNHIGFGVQSVKRIHEAVKSANVPGVKVGDIRDVSSNNQDICDFFTPEGMQIEITEEAGVPPFPRLSPDIALESNQLHMAPPPSAREAMQDWYVKAFGFKLTPRKRGPEGAIPGMQFMKYEFAQKLDVPIPTKGRVLDHIGFEVTNLQVFTKKLEASGVKLDQPYSKKRHKSFANAELTDPWGVSIELTEGLNRF